MDPATLERMRSVLRPEDIAALLGVDAAGDIQRAGGAAAANLELSAIQAASSGAGGGAMRAAPGLAEVQRVGAAALDVTPSTTTVPASTTSNLGLTSGPTAGLGANKPGPSAGDVGTGPATKVTRLASTDDAASRRSSLLSGSSDGKGESGKVGGSAGKDRGMTRLAPGSGDTREFGKLIEQWKGVVDSEEIEANREALLPIVENLYAKYQKQVEVEERDKAVPSYDNAIQRMGAAHDSLCARLFSLSDLDAVEGSNPMSRMAALRASLSKDCRLHPRAIVGDVPVKSSWHGGRIICDTPSDIALKVMGELLTDFRFECDDFIYQVPGSGGHASIGTLPGGCLHVSMREEASSENMGMNVTDWTSMKRRFFWLFCSTDQYHHSVRRTLSSAGSMALVVGVDPATRLAHDDKGPAELKSVVTALGFGPGALSGPTQVVEYHQAVAKLAPMFDITSVLVALWRAYDISTMVQYFERGNNVLNWLPPAGGWPGGGGNFGATYPVPAAGRWNIFGGSSEVGSRLSDGYHWLKAHAGENNLVWILNSVEAWTQSECMALLTVYYDHPCHIGWPANTGLVGGRNVQNRLNGFKLWSTNYIGSQYHNIAIFIRGGFNTEQLNTFPAPTLNGLPAGWWPPASPADALSAADALAQIDNMCMLWGAERQSVAARQLSKTMVKGFPNPGPFGTGGAPESETIASRAARAAVNTANAAAKTAYDAQVAAYEAALAALGPGRAAAVAAGAVARGAAVDPPHPGDFTPVPVPAAVNIGHDAPNHEPLHNGIGQRIIVDCMLRQQQFEHPRPVFTGLPDVLGRTDAAMVDSRVASASFTNLFRWADPEDGIRQLMLLNDTEAYSTQCAYRALGLRWQDRAPSDVAQTGAVLYNALSMDVPPALSNARVAYRRETMVEPSQASAYHNFTRLGVEIVRQVAMRTGMIMGPSLAATVTASSEGLSGFPAANSPYGWATEHNCVVLLMNKETHCARMPHAAFGVVDDKASVYGLDLELAGDTVGSRATWTQDHINQQILLGEYHVRKYNGGFAEPMVGARTATVLVNMNQHGWTEVTGVKLVEKRYRSDQTGNAVIIDPVLTYAQAQRANERLAADYPWTDVTKKRIYDILLTGVTPGMFEHLSAVNKVQGTFASGMFAGMTARMVGRVDNQRAPVAFVASSPYMRGAAGAAADYHDELDMVTNRLDGLL